MFSTLCTDFIWFLSESLDFRWSWQNSQVNFSGSAWYLYLWTLSEFLLLKLLSHLSQGYSSISSLDWRTKSANTSENSFWGVRLHAGKVSTISIPSIIVFYLHFSTLLGRVLKWWYLDFLSLYITPCCSHKSWKTSISFRINRTTDFPIDLQNITNYQGVHLCPKLVVGLT